MGTPRYTRPMRLIAMAMATGIVVASAGAAASATPRSEQKPRAIPSSAQKGSKHMDEFKVGDVVRITGAIMPGAVGTVVSKDEKRRKYLVRVTDRTQNYYPAEEIEHFKP